MTPPTTVVVSRILEASMTVEELLEGQLELGLNRAKGGEPSFSQWGKDSPFVSWDK
ncbi:hypothetical protein Pa4123_51480 [Phytohabitans aurantiacus]|uniref:Uncharacterized protein n=1 Tax=Phytohabitans aurantiacus TaxID=3016789 RepID=A0ABQ5R003_9ACTN|nr:hypothetical protein Pa4123_51480 [Phytohabitans aurantiacus]